MLVTGGRVGGGLEPWELFGREARARGFHRREARVMRVE